MLTVLDSIDATIYVADMTTHEILFANRYMKECFGRDLMGLQGNASLMLGELNEGHPHHERFRNIEQYVRRGAELTRQLLGFARGGVCKVEPVDLNDLVKKSATLFIRTKKEITLHAKYQADLWPALVDQGQIEQALLNLYINAWQSMPAGGTLTVSTVNFMMSEETARASNLASGKYIRLSIADTGVGMDKATRERIFEPFFTTKEMGRGTGLGLASVYGIIRNHGGAVGVESREGEGTVFRIYLPASKSKPLQKKEETLPEVLNGSGTILLVDDEEMITQVGGEILEKIGFKVLLANSGKQAVELFRRRPDSIDLVILDMIMPEMNGPEVFDRLREFNPRVKVLLSSGYAMEGAARELLRKGCRGFIQKPYNIDELSKKVRTVMEQGGAS